MGQILSLELMERMCKLLYYYFISTLQKIILLLFSYIKRKENEKKKPSVLCFGWLWLTC